MIQRLKEEGVKHVNKVATEILPNRTEAAVQRIRTKLEYKQAEERVNQRKILHQSAANIISKTKLSQIETPKPIPRTPQILLTVLPTPISAVSQRRRSLPTVPLLPAKTSQYTSTTLVGRTSFQLISTISSEETSKSVRWMRKVVMHVPARPLCTDSMLQNAKLSISASLPELHQMTPTSSKRAPELDD